MHCVSKYIAPTTKTYNMSESPFPAVKSTVVDTEQLCDTARWVGRSEFQCHSAGDWPRSFLRTRARSMNNVINRTIMRGSFVLVVMVANRKLYCCCCRLDEWTANEETTSASRLSRYSREKTPLGICTLGVRPYSVIIRERSLMLHFIGGHLTVVNLWL